MMISVWVDGPTGPETQPSDGPIAAESGERPSACQRCPTGVRSALTAHSRPSSSGSKTSGRGVVGCRPNGVFNATAWPIAALVVSACAMFGSGLTRLQATALALSLDAATSG